MNLLDKASIREVIEIAQRLETKIDDLKDFIFEKYVSKEDFIPVKKDVEDLVRWKYYFTGIAAAVAAIISFIINYLLSKLL